MLTSSSKGNSPMIFIKQLMFRPASELPVLLTQSISIIRLQPSRGNCRKVSFQELTNFHLVLHRFHNIVV